MIYGSLQAPPLSPPQPINTANHAQTNKYHQIIICRYQKYNEYYLNIIISIMTIMIYGCLQALPLSPDQPINIATSKSRQDKYLLSLYFVLSLNIYMYFYLYLSLSLSINTKTSKPSHDKSLSFKPLV